ncbi:N5-carboxyaminoimidazole ribonucleotide synthase [Rubripirellula amarantea]|uniref:N5-carboxyaminoimidazole ribonucleotide synthase n=1 Tax=Rubripirellula amarantea TaxID=2527999 RepID=A0A5C5WKL7_9BACT|nr:5-(carboxyamino)imidazole ribonucleotide synthase [Rubripirellula amarantea]TWT50629.1 N5-carboxyaminoimidazole ribonucleotide synthase [Rubripirellula amarantea]
MSRSSQQSSTQHSESHHSESHHSESRHAQARLVNPGATIGMVGGGQLGRMFAMAAASMGYRVVVFCESSDTPAAQVAHHTVVGKLDDETAVESFASMCDVITLEFENIPAATMERCADHAPTYPAHRVLEIAQDRLLEKSTLAGAGLRVTPFVEVSNNESLLAASETLGWPMVVKTARDGYDGKGQYKISSADELGQVDWSSASSWIAEQWMPFDIEVSVVVAISSNGESTTFPVFENQHRNHILDVSVTPASITEALATRAREVATRAAQTLGVVGLLCVEFFVVGDDVVINEVAPRPHNSGHLTIEACHTSQFEQHVRAVCGLPLGSTTLRCPFAAMSNLLGDVWLDDQDQLVTPRWNDAISIPAIALHLYGKHHPQRSRKMGHLTTLGQTRDEVIERVTAARAKLSP